MHLAASFYPNTIPPSSIRRHVDHPQRRCHRPHASSSTSSSPAAQDFEAFVLSTQASIIKTTQSLENTTPTTPTTPTTTKSFIQDRWERQGPATSGYGITAVLEGSIVEKAAVNISVIHGTLTPERAKAMSTRGRSTINPEGGDPYHAVALSLVFHSANPHIPTLRADVRLFEAAGQQAWYGGGCDLTPFYLYEDDARKFHCHWKGICDNYSTALYPEYKEWCDRYFYIPCRKEHRGLGGIFFDDLDSTTTTTTTNNNNNGGQTFDAVSFVKDVGTNILPSWLPIVEAHRNTPITDEQREWQLERRGRYLEFNLLYDRGVKFGLEGGRIESIMVSAPPLISWKYRGGENGGGGGGGSSGEERRREALLEVLRQPREWV